MKTYSSANRRAPSSPRTRANRTGAERLLLARLGAVAFATLLLAVAPARADVLIYQGSLRTKADLSSDLPFPALLRQYRILDFDSSLAATVTFFGDKNQKRYVVSGPGPLRAATSQIAGGKTATVLSASSSSDTDAANFYHHCSYFRGTNTTLSIQTSPTLTAVNRPRGLIGILRTASAATGNGSFLEIGYALTFQSIATLKANNAGQTIQQVIDSLASELEAKGYTSL